MGLLDRVNFRAADSAPPEAIDVTGDGRLRITWPGGEVAQVPFAVLRDLCPCAECVEEWTGRKLLDPAKIPADIRPLAIEPVGNYAVRFAWSDGHGAGIYTWATLRKAAASAP